MDLPLVGRAECNQLLAPEFRGRGVTSWAGISPSELCAGGRGKDACAGEGGAPLVCLDEVSTLRQELFKETHFLINQKIET